MVKLGLIASRAVGVAGIGLGLYDSIQTSKISARKQAHKTTADWLENVYFSSRTTDNVSSVSNDLRAKTFDMRTKNPIPTMYGKAKGAVNGMLYGLGVNLPIILCSSLALIGKNTVAKCGAIGAALCVAYDIARNGFGLGKQNPMK
ncbi:MAG: hypothetical protein E7Z89_06525 [Cyanobacteria bacterium SIG28]|nr:hypothetical protein [Cyanobacteria bacterium SIG28]